MNGIIIYNLVLELRNGDYNVVEIERIPNANVDCPNSIGEIDAFTMQYSVDELKDLIAKNNLVAPEYLKGTFKIISNMKHKLPAFSKEDYEIINEISGGHLEFENSLKDKLYGYYKKTLEKYIDGDYFYDSLRNFKSALNSNNYHEVFNSINKIPYSNGRAIYLMLSDEIKRRKEEEKIRKLEKLDEVA